jgi:RimJ/RimL family protein N-acetyltransferase
VDPPRNKRHPKRIVRFQCGRYFARTIRREDASDRWASWLSDSWTKHVLNPPQQALKKSDIVEYIKKFDQRSNLLLGIFDIRTRTHVGIIRADIDYARREVRLNAIIGEPEHRNRGATADVFVPLLDYLFDQVRLNKATASILARNQVTIRYLLKVGWRVDQASEKQIKSHSDGTMLDRCMLSLTPDAWRAVKETTLAKRVMQRISNTERARAVGASEARSRTAPADTKS